MNKNIELHKNGGFYSVFGESTYILYYLFNYRIIENRVGFPISAHDKVISKLEELNINYIDTFANITKNYKKRNRFNEFVEKGKKKYSLIYRINEINKKLELLTEDKIDNILNYIETIIADEK